MDHANPIETPTTYRLHRAEYIAGFAAVTGLIIAHFGEIRWLPFVGLFLYIDLIGYIPGAIAYRRSPTGDVSKRYYLAYNFMHSLVTQGVVALLWMWLVQPEWALLALPFHLFGDRGLFGNFLKPFGLAFEPEPNPAYTRLAKELTSRRRPLPEGQLAEPDGQVLDASATGR